MAPIKRKGNVAEEATSQKRARVGADKKDHKKQKTNASDDTKSKSEAPKPTDLSVLRDDEPAFPRGGSSVLTPLERKQIQIQAQKDVLFEQKGSEKSHDDAEDDDEEGKEDIDMDDANDTAAKKPRKQRKTKAAKKKADKEAAEKKGVRVEGLNFKVCRRIYARCYYKANLKSVLYLGL